MKLSVTLPYTDRVPLDLLLPFVRSADKLGYDTVWVPEAYGWDGFTILARLACETERIKLATGIVNVFSRSPALLGQSAASLDMLTGGRFVLGLGTSGHQVVSGWHGVDFRDGVRRMSEATDIIRLVVARQPVTYEGQVFHLDKGLRLMTHPVRTRIPIYLATTTRTGVELAGEKADGWLPIFFSPAHFEQRLRPQLEAGAARAGRSVDEVAICVFGQLVVVTNDIERGRDSVRPHLALYIGGMGSREKNYYNRLFRGYGFEQEAARIQDLYLDRRHKEAAAAVTSEMIDLVSIIGPVEECRRRLFELERCGVDEVAIALSTPDNDPLQLMSALEGLAA